MSSAASDAGAETRSLGSLEPLPAIDLLVESASTVRRYLMIDELGRGSIGRVMRAYDPKLQREVALKVLRADTIDPVGRSQLLREARVMAKLSHPNVVAVYDVDIDPLHGVIVAMELVDGCTLREWLSREQPPPRRVIESFVEAGRGLAAAHRAGLLHRDFKPSNVLVASSGRVQVTDFGLAKPQGGASPASERSERGRKGSADTGSDGDPTESGTIMGTPKYMAPEQHRGRPLTPAADQYAFCTALWEAVVGEYPFDPRNVVRSKFTGPPRWPSARGLPRSVGEILSRGLAPSVDERWSDMDALLDALTSAVGRPRRRSVVLGMGLVVTVGAAGWWSRGDPEQEAIERCRAEGRAIDTLWNSEVEQRVREGLLGTGVAYAASAVDVVVPRLEHRAEAWRAARTEACLDAGPRRAWDQETLGRAEWCLDERRHEFGALLEQLAHADDAVAWHAADAAAELTSVESCRVRAELDEQLELPPVEDRARAAELNAELFHARALLAAGKYGESLERLEPLMVEATELAWPLLSARLTALHAKLLRRLGEYARAERVGRAAYMQAVRIGAWRLASSIACELAFTVGTSLQRVDDGWLWLEHAQAVAQHVDDTSGLLRARRLHIAGGLEMAVGSFEQAREHLDETMTLWESALGPGHPWLVGVQINQATVYHRLGAVDEARELLERLVETRRRALGSNHPEVARAMNNLANSYFSLGRYEQARDTYRQAIDITERTLGADHPKRAVPMLGLSTTYGKLEEWDSALTVGTRALAIVERSMGAQDPSLVPYINTLGLHELEVDHEEQARALFERAIELQERAQVPDSSRLARMLRSLASVVPEAEAGALIERAEQLERALAPSSAESTAP